MLGDAMMVRKIRLFIQVISNVDKSIYIWNISKSALPSPHRFHSYHTIIDDAAELMMTKLKSMTIDYIRWIRI